MKFKNGRRLAALAVAAAIGISDICGTGSLVYAGQQGYLLETEEEQVSQDVTKDNAKRAELPEETREAELPKDAQEGLSTFSSGRSFE